MHEHIKSTAPHTHYTNSKMYSDEKLKMVHLADVSLLWTLKKKNHLLACIFVYMIASEIR